MLNEFITPEEIAKEMGTNVNYVYNLLTCEYICSIRLGRKYKIRYIWFEDFLDEMKGKELPSYQALENEAYKIRHERKVA